jgi:hypothetical protein
MMAMPHCCCPLSNNTRLSMMRPYREKRSFNSAVDHERGRPLTRRMLWGRGKEEVEVGNDMGERGGSDEHQGEEDDAMYRWRRSGV